MKNKIPLTKGKYAIVDEKDYEYLMKWKWYALKSKNAFYAARRQKNSEKEEGDKEKLIFMHRVILDAPKGMEVDHINGEGLDNQRSNIRLATHAQNMANRKPWGTSKYLGVYWEKHRSKWRAQIRKSGKGKKLGIFKEEEDAARAYDVAAKKYHKEFANLNF